MVSPNSSQEGTHRLDGMVRRVQPSPLNVPRLIKLRNLNRNAVVQVVRDLLAVLIRTIRLPKM